MKRNTIRTLGVIALTALISMSCMLFQANRDAPSEADTQPEPPQELSEELAETAEMPPTDSPPATEAPFGDYELPDMSPSSLAPGTFQYVIVGAEEDVNVEEGTLQYQSTSDEYVIGLISKDARNSLSLILPLDISAGPLPLIPYESGSFTKGPTSAIYIGFHLYIADGGVVMFEAVDDTITGSFVFVAHDKDDPTQVVAVTGVFNKIPLAEE